MNLLYGRYYTIKRCKSIVVSENKLKYCGGQQYLGETKHNFFDAITRLVHWLSPDDVEVLNEQ